MKLTSLLITGALLCGSVAPLVQAQGQQGGQAAPASAASAPAASSASSLDTQGLTNYLLAPGDTIDVRVFGQPELNTTADVDSDGNISSLPFIEDPVPAQCRTDKQVQADIRDAYSQYLKNPQVSVRIIGRNSRLPAIVYGAVNVPQRVQMQRNNVHLSELLTASGGVTERNNGMIQILHTQKPLCPTPDEAIEPSTDVNGRLPFKVYKLSEMLTGKADVDPIIRPGDIVTATMAEPVYITGSVIQPQGLYLRPDYTLGRVLAMVGGARKEAKLTDVRIYRQKPGSPEQETIHVDYAAIKKQQKPDVLLQPYDIIDVPDSSPLSRGNLGRTLLNTVAGFGPGVATSIATTLPWRVIY